MRLRHFLATFLCGACLLTPPARAAETQYIDLVGDEWFYESAMEMTERGLMNGYSDYIEGPYHFGPYQPVTRATVVTVLWRLYGSPAASLEEPFPDTVGTWYETSAAWAKDVGLSGGYDNGCFGGEDYITREQLAVFLYRYAALTGQPLASGALGLLTDADQIAEWAVDAVRHAVGAGIIQGDQGWFYPQLTANRASLAVILHRMLTPAAG